MAEISVGKVIVHKVSCAIHSGQIINPSIVEAQMESSIVYGLSAALKDEIIILDGHVVQRNFHDFDVLRMDEMPEVEIQIVKSKDDPGLHLLHLRLPMQFLLLLGFWFAGY